MINRRSVGSVPTPGESKPALRLIFSGAEDATPREAMVCELPDMALYLLSTPQLREMHECQTAQVAHADASDLRRLLHRISEIENELYRRGIRVRS